MKIELKMDTMESPDQIMYLFKTPVDFINRIGGRNERGAVEEVRVNELGAPIDFLRSPTNPSNLHAKYSHGNVESMIERIHSHLYDLLGNRTEFRMWSLCRAITQYLPMLPNIRKFGIRDGAFALKRIDEFLSRSTCLEYFMWHARHKKRRTFEESSKIYELDTVDVMFGTPVARDLMKHFNGRHLFLDSENIRETDVIEFLNAWKSGEKFRNLEVICIVSLFEVPEIRSSVEFKELDTRVVYSLTKKVPCSLIDSSEFESRTYMVRDSDDHVASVLLEGNIIFLGVWNMREKEFLEKFQ